MDLYRYIENHSTPQGEALDWVERQTNIRTNHSRMLSGAVQGRFIMMLTEMIRPARILELGTSRDTRPFVWRRICLRAAIWTRWR